jgi:hypothetical protein
MQMELLSLRLADLLNIKKLREGVVFDGDLYILVYSRIRAIQ